MAEYIYLIHPYRDGFFEQATSEEEAILEEHYQYLKRASEMGIILLAGPCLDQSFGLVVFHAEDDESAQAFMFRDPCVKKNIMMAELHPLHISLQSKL